MQVENDKVSEKEELTFGRYVPKKLLGKGAMGKVYLSEDPVLQRPVAVKVISIEENIDNQTRSAFLERFTLEARASAKLRHPSVVTVYDAGEQNGFPWIAFEFIEGESLEDLLAREKKLPLKQIYHILIDIASALQHAHDAGIVHRDVKPANILIDKNTGISKLSDFGVVKAPFSMVTQEGVTVGSPGYMSPEQIDGSGVDPRSDLFSLGIIFYQMLTGKHPFVRDTLQSTLFATLMSDYTPVRQLCPEVNDETEQFINKLLKVDKNERVSSAQEFITYLKKISSGQSGAGGISSSFDTSNRPEFRKNKDGKIAQVFSSIGSKAGTAFFKVAQNKYTKVFFNKSKNGFQKTSTAAFNQVKKINFKTLRKNRGLKLSALILSVFLFLSLSTLMMYSKFFSYTKEEKNILRELASDGFTGSPEQLIDKCRELIRRNELGDAKSIAEGLAKIRKSTAVGNLLLARIELRDGDEDDAVEAFNNAKRISNFKNALSNEKSELLIDLKEFLAMQEISKEMIDCITYTLTLARDRTLRKWVFEKAYWLRWNTIHIMNESGQKVDMIEVYILDLKHGGSIRTRLKAATKLGEIGDKRAVPALEEIAQRGFADPIVSASAQSVLDEYFKK